MDTIIEVQNLEVIYKEKDIFKRLKNGKKKFGIRDINFQVRITSYNVCYTKLLRMHDQGAAGSINVAGNAFVHGKADLFHPAACGAVHV